MLHWSCWVALLSWVVQGSFIEQDDRAIQQLEQGITWYHRAEHTRYVSDFDRALRHLQASLRSREDPKTLFYMGAVLNRLGQFNDAIEAYESCLRLLGHRNGQMQSLVAENMAGILARMHRWQHAASVLKRALALLKDSSGANSAHQVTHLLATQIKLGKTLCHSGEPVDGLRYLAVAARDARSLYASSRAAPADVSLALTLADAHYELARMAELFHPSSVGFSHLHHTVLSNFSASQAVVKELWLSFVSLHACASNSSVSVLRSERIGTSCSFLNATTFHSPGAEAGLYGCCSQDCDGVLSRIPARWAPLCYMDDRTVVATHLSWVALLGNDGVVVDSCGHVLLSHHGLQLPLHRNILIQDSESPRAFQSLQAVASLCDKDAKDINMSDVATERVRGSAISLLGLFAGGFYHFVTDALPRLLYALTHIGRNIRIIVPSNYGEMHRFIRETLHDILHIPQEQLIHHTIIPQSRSKHAARATGVRLLVEHLIVVDWHRTNTSASTRHDLHHIPPPAALQLLRSVLQPSVVRHPATPIRLVYIQRLKASSRVLGNEAEVHGALKAFVADTNSRNGCSSPHPSRGDASSSAGCVGQCARCLELITFSDSPRTPDVASAWRTFAGADVVIGVHGAGLANIVMCDTGAHVIELTLPEPHSHYYAHIAAALSLKYHSVPLTGSPPSQDKADSGDGSDTAVDACLYAGRPVFVSVAAVTRQLHRALAALG